MPHTILRSQTVLPVRGHLARPREPATDLANRQAVASDPVKHLADETGFVGNDLIARLPTALILRDVAVAIGRPAEHIHGARPVRHAACHAGGVR